MVDQLEQQLEAKREQVVADILSYLNQEVTMIDAICHYSETHGVEVEVLAELVKDTPSIKARLVRDAEKLNLIEKTHRLPI